MPYRSGLLFEQIVAWTMIALSRPGTVPPAPKPLDPAHLPPRHVTKQRQYSDQPHAVFSGQLASAHGGSASGVQKPTPAGHSTRLCLWHTELTASRSKTSAAGSKQKRKHVPFLYQDSFAWAWLTSVTQNAPFNRSDADGATVLACDHHSGRARPLGRRGIGLAVRPMAAKCAHRIFSRVLHVNQHGLGIRGDH